MKAGSLCVCMCALALALTATAVAAPTYKRATKLDPTLSEHVRAAEQAWTAAEATPDPAHWEEAARAFALVDGDAIDIKLKREAAYAAILAWKNAMQVAPAEKTAKPDDFDAAPKPRPLPDREKQFIAAIDRYASYSTDASDPDLPGLLLLKARAYARFDHHETAIPIYRDLITRFPRQDAALYAAQLLLDAYNRLHQYDKLIALADEIAANKSFLANRDDLAETVKRIQQQAQRRRAEQLESDAKESKELEKYVAAGQAYLDIYNADPNSKYGDEALYNAAVSFEEGAAMASAIQTYALLRNRYPQSKITVKATARLGKLYGDLAMYDKAAAMLEEYAKKYAGEKDAYDAMSDAVFYRRALGQRAKAIEDTKYFVRTWGSKKPREAAHAMWSLSSLYEGDALLAHLREYIRTYGTKGGHGILVAAYAKVGLVLWKQSCKGGGFDGLCVKASALRPRTCGKGTAQTLTAITRDARKTKEALAAFAAAMKEYEKQRVDAEFPDSTYYYAQAKLALADLELERYLALALPQNLDFAPKTREASMKRFDAWLVEKQKLGATARRRYDEVFAIKDADTSITASERIALVTQSFASMLVGNAASGSVGPYCETMTQIAEPLEATALEGFGVCLAKSTELGWFNDASASCERELIRLAPNTYPPAREHRSEPLHDAPAIASEPPLR